MVEISNRTLAVLLVVTLVVSVGGVLINLSKLFELTRIVSFSPISGFVTTLGTVNMTLTSNVEINLSTYQIEFGPGYVAAGAPAARLNTTDSWRGKENWTNATNYNFNPSNITIENTGNRNASVNFTSDRAAAAFIGGTSPVFQYKGKVKSGEGATTCSTDNITSSYTAVGTAEANGVCKCLRFEDANDELRVDVWVLVPNDAPIGQKNATLTFTASDWSGSNKIC